MYQRYETTMLVSNWLWLVIVDLTRSGLVLIANYFVSLVARFEDSPYVQRQCLISCSQDAILKVVKGDTDIPQVQILGGSD